MGNTLSDQYDLENGCPQGSVISPILFNRIINTLHTALENNQPISISGYADDSAIWRKLFTRKQNIKTDNLNLTLFGKKIEFVIQIKLLGLTFDSQLKWDAHITHLKVKR